VRIYIFKWTLDENVKDKVVEVFKLKNFWKKGQNRAITWL